MDNFESSLKYFRWMNIYVVPHTHRAISFVVRECQKVAQMSLFTTSYGKNVTLAEFQEIQLQTTNNVSRLVFSNFIIRFIRTIVRKIIVNIVLTFCIRAFMTSYPLLTVD